MKRLTRISFLFCVFLVFVGWGLYAEEGWSIGIGAKYLARTPFAIATIQIGNWGAELGAWFSTMSYTYGEFSANLSLLWYSGIVKFFVGPPAFDFVLPYLGAGIIGVHMGMKVADQSATGDVLGINGAVGVEFLLNPFTVFAGMNWLGMGNAVLQGGGQTYSIPTNMAGFAFHLGAEFNF